MQNAGRQIIGQAGKTPMSKSELERLHKEVIVDPRFTHMGFRYEGGFIGDHDLSSKMPIPKHISAKHQDLNTLMNGLIRNGENFLKDSELSPLC